MSTLAAHDRRIKKLEGEGRWVRETLSRIAESMAHLGERMTVLTQRFGLMESDLRDIKRVLTTHEDCK